MYCNERVFVTTKRFQQQYHCFDMGTYESAWKNACHHMLVHDVSWLPISIMNNKSSSV